VPTTTGKGDILAKHPTLCGILIALVAVSGQARQPVKSDQEVLIDLERRWNGAVYENDVKFVASILAEEFTVTYEDGSRGDKAKELALIAAFNQKVESAVQDEFTIKVFGNTAVVWFTLRLVGFKQGQRSELTLRYTDVWIVRDGRWQCVSAHSTRVTAK
jgi:ketosteroid isomerase-like protein